MKKFVGVHDLAYDTIFGIVSIESVGNVFGFKLHSPSVVKLDNPKLELLDRIYSRQCSAIIYLEDLEKQYILKTADAIEKAVDKAMWKSMGIDINDPNVHIMKVNNEN